MTRVFLSQFLNQLSGSVRRAVVNKDDLKRKLAERRLHLIDNLPNRRRFIKYRHDDRKAGLGAGLVGHRVHRDSKR